MEFFIAYCKGILLAIYLLAYIHVIIKTGSADSTDSILTH